MQQGTATAAARARTRAVTGTARGVSGVAVTLGLLGLLNTGPDDLGSDSAETLFMFLVHPVTAIVWLVVGLVGIAMAVDPARARLFLLVVGPLLLAWALLALALGDDASQALTRDRDVVALHLIGGLLCVLAAAAPLPTAVVRVLDRPAGDG